jgi:hypothetical protein
LPTSDLAASEIQKVRTLQQKVSLRNEPLSMMRKLAHIRSVIREASPAVQGLALQIFPRAEQAKTKKAWGVEGDVLAAPDLQVQHPDPAHGVPVLVAGDAGLQL